MDDSSPLCCDVSMGASSRRDQPREFMESRNDDDAMVGICVWVWGVCVSECYATQGGSSGFGLTDLMQEYMPVVDSDNLLGSMPLESHRGERYEWGCRAAREGV